MPRITYLAWAAGLIDGEGCLYINRQRASRRKDLKRDSFRFYLKVTMGDLPTLERLHSILGLGTIVDHVDREKIRGKANPSWSYLAASRQAEQVLLTLKPYLFTKAAEVDVSLEFLQLGNAPLGGRGGGKPVPDLLLEKRIGLYWRLRELKSRWCFYKVKLDEQARKQGVEPEYAHYL